MRTHTAVTELPRPIERITVTNYLGYEIRFHTKKFHFAGYQDFYDIYKDDQKIKSFTYFLGESSDEALQEVHNWITSHDYVEHLIRRG